MNKTKIKKAFVIFVCVLLVLSTGLFFAYEKHRVKPLFRVLPLDRDAITEVKLEYFRGRTIELSAQQRDDLCSLFEDCSVKFWSSNDALANYYASAMVSTNHVHTVEIMFSEDGHIAAINKLRHSYGFTIYTIVDGGDALYQYLSSLEQ